MSSIPGDGAPLPRQSGLKQVIFRITALVLVPLLFLLVAEGVLRIADVGYDASFLLERTEKGTRYVIQNDRYGWRFFPKAIARSPSPIRFEAIKKPGTTRVFVLGESAALGDPKPGFSFGRQLEVVLSERNPGMSFEVIPVAMTAINSHAIVPIARQCMRYQGDYWIVYMGNNEMEGPFGANSIFGPRAPQYGMIRATVAAKGTRLGQFITSLSERRTAKTDEPGTWDGMRMFLKQQLPADDARRAIVHDHYRRNLHHILDDAASCGAVPILCTVAGNLKDCPPFASLPGSKIGTSDRTRWQEKLNEAAKAQSASQWDAAGKLLDSLIHDDPWFAEAHFRRGATLWETGDTTGARRAWEQARDTDALPFRTDSELNRIIREEAAARSKGSSPLLFVDVEAELAKSSPGSVPGMEYFFDHVHYTLEGNYRVATILAEALQSRITASGKSPSGAAWLPAEQCLAQLGLTDWNRLSIEENMLQRLADAPFTNQMNHPERERRRVGTIVQLRTRLKSASPDAARAVIDAAVQKRPTDPRLRENRAEFLEATGNPEAAVEDWNKVVELLPHHFQGYFQAGRLLSKLKKDDAALGRLQEAIQRRPDLAEAWMERAQIHRRSKQWNLALDEATEAKRLRPADPRPILLMAHVYGGQGRMKEGLAMLQEAARVKPNYWEARYLLGVELAAQGSIREARVEFEEAVRLRPDLPAGHFNLGVALAKLGVFEEAAAQFTETLRLDPKHAQARAFLQKLEQARSGLPPARN